MNQLIAYFEYEGNNYLISLINKKKICFFKKNDKGELIDNLSPLEYKMMKKVYDSLVIEPNRAIFIKKITVNSNLYNLFYDDKSNNYFWTSNDNKYNKKDNLFLNFRYNHQPDVLYLGLDSEHSVKSSPEFYNKLIKIGKKIVVLCVTAVLALTMLVGCASYADAEKIDATVAVPETIAAENIEPTEDDALVIIYGEENLLKAEGEGREYNWEDIKQALESNPNISDEEKELILSLKFVFDKDYQYMYLHGIIERLSTLQILYGFTEEELSANGTYKISENTIRIAAPSFEEANIGVIIHEIGHVFQESNGSLLFELSNEKWSREVLWKLYNDNLIDKRLFLNARGKEQYDKGELTFEEDPDYFLYRCSSTFSKGYNIYMPLYCILADLLPQETLISYHYNSYNNHTRIDYDLVECFDNLRIYDSTSGTYQLSGDLTQVLTQLDYFYTKAKGMSINDNLEYHIIFAEVSNRAETGDYFLSGYDHSTSFLWDRIYDKYNKYSFVNILLVKPYFGYSENSSNVITSSFETVDINEELLSEFNEYINSIEKSINQR